MKKIYLVLVLCTALTLTACGGNVAPTAPSTAPVTTAPDTTPPTTLPPETVPPTTLSPETTVPVTQPEHSDLYIPGLDVEDVILYFNEVVLDAEFVESGSPELVQKWVNPIGYKINGTATEQDMEVLEGFVAWLNTIEGFPGMFEAGELYWPDLDIHFCTREELVNILGDNYAGCDGGVTFWYDDNEIYTATICYVDDLDQEVRNSVILEEIFNGLGPVQDTDLREDSIAYSGYSIPQELTEIDELILKLLYHPDIVCGMNAQECEAVIRQLYY